MPKKLSKYCSINKFLEVYDKELYEVIEDLCLHRIFSPRGGKGVTFLYPKEASYRKKIIDTAFGDNPEKAIQMLQSLVITDYLPSPSDFITKKDDIPNALRQKIEVASADAKSVKLECGATLIKESEFHPIETRNNMAVYVLTGNMIPLDGKPSVGKYVKRSKTGGVDETDKKRCIYATHLEEKYKMCLYKNNNYQNPYYEAIVSFYMWSLINGIDLSIINKYMDWCPAVSFYLVFEPHSQNPQVVSRDLFNRWLNETGGKCPVDPQKIVQTYDYIMNKVTELTSTFKDIDAKIAERASIQDKLLKEPFKPTLSENALKYYGKNLTDAFKDECRFLIYQYMLDISEYPESEAGRCTAYENMLVFVRYLANNVPNDASGLLCLNQSLQNRNDPAAWVSSAYAFVRSDAFLYIPIPPSLISSPKLGITKVDGPNLTSNALVNLSYIKRELLKSHVKSLSMDSSHIKTLCGMAEEMNKMIS
jgi:hypothetical protein